MSPSAFARGRAALRLNEPASRIECPKCGASFKPKAVGDEDEETPKKKAVRAEQDGDDFDFELESASKKKPARNVHRQEEDDDEDDRPARKSREREEDEDGLVLVTFDDAVSDQYVHALPILEEYQVPSVIFAPMRPYSDESDRWTTQHLLHALLSIWDGRSLNDASTNGRDAWRSTSS